MVKSSGGSAWLAWGVAVVVTTLVGVLAFSVFVLSKVFGSSSPDSDAAPPPTHKLHASAFAEPAGG
jgi:flagellar basal body-associated protein FliL